MTVRRLQHVSIGVPPARLEECVAFYRDVLGMEPIPNLAGTARLRFGDGDHLHLLDDDPNPTGAHFALQVDDLPATLQRVRADGAPLERGSDLWGAERWFVRDPAGNRVEVFETPPE